MAVAKMGSGDEKKSNPTAMFHDFLGMSSAGDEPSSAVWAKNGVGGGDRVGECEASVSAASMGASSGGNGLVSRSSDLGSDKPVLNNYDGFHFHGRKGETSMPGSSNKFSGRKRSNSDSTFMGLTRETTLPVVRDSPEWPHLTKMFGKEHRSEWPRRSTDDEMMFALQPQLKPASTSSLHWTFSGRPNPVISKEERSMSMNFGQTMQQPSCSIQGIPCANREFNPNAGAVLTSQAAADEGSRTGIKGSGVLKIINRSGVAIERNPTGMLPSSNRPRVSPQIKEPESSNLSVRQMTIFYAGQAHVFDDVHPNKADVIMSLAGSNGESWSTTYSAKSNSRLPNAEAKLPTGENQAGSSSSSFLQDLNRGLFTQTNNHSQVTRAHVCDDVRNLTPVLIPGAHQGGKDVKGYKTCNSS